MAMMESCRSTIILMLILFASKIFCVPVKSNVKLTANKIVAIRQIGEKLKESVNAEVNPCVDYYSYICTHYNSSAKIPDSYRTRLKNFADLQKFFVKAIKAKIEFTLGDFTPNCQEKADRYFLQFIKDFNLPDSIGGWPVFNSNWSGDKFDLNSAILEMKAYSIPVLIDPTFVEEEKTLKRYFLIQPITETFLSDDSKRTEFVDKLMQYSFNSVDANKVVNQCANFEHNVTEILSNFVIRSEKDSVIETNYKDLRKIFPEIDLHKHFKIISEQQLDDSYPVVIKYPEAIKGVLTAIKNMPPELVANYFFCHFVKSSFDVKANLSNQYSCMYTAFLYSPRDAAKELFENAFDDINKQEFMAILYSTARILNDSLGVFEGASMNDIKTRVQEFVVDNDIMDVVDENSESRIVLQNEFYLNRQILRRLSSYFTDNTENKLKLSFATLPSIIISYLVLGLYHLPSAYVFEAMTKDLIPLAVLLSQDPNNFTKTTKDCFQFQMGQEKLENRYLFDVLAAQIYFRAFLDWADNRKEILQLEDEILMEYGLANKELLFENFMRDSCDKESNLALMYLKNTKEFSEVYNCPIGSPMNPVKKCKI